MDTALAQLQYLPRKYLPIIEAGYALTITHNINTYARKHLTLPARAEIPDNINTSTHQHFNT
nr:MAG: hypothetical protein DIU61_06395 [Bacteroidota bacterium]